MVSCSLKYSGKVAWKSQVKSAFDICEASDFVDKANCLDVFQVP